MLGHSVISIKILLFLKILKVTSVDNIVAWKLLKPGLPFEAPLESLLSLHKEARNIINASFSRYRYNTLNYIY